MKPINVGGLWHQVCDCGTEVYEITWECPACHAEHWGWRDNFCRNCGEKMEWED